MRSREYRQIIRGISRRAIKARFPGLEQKHIDEVATKIAVNIHARMYGANINGVESPLWREDEPTVTAQQILETT